RRTDGFCAPVELPATKAHHENACPQAGTDARRDAIACSDSEKPIEGVTLRSVPQVRTRCGRSEQAFLRIGHSPHRPGSKRAAWPRCAAASADAGLRTQRREAMARPVSGS